MPPKKRKIQPLQVSVHFLYIFLSSKIAYCKHKPINDLEDLILEQSAVYCPEKLCAQKYQMFVFSFYHFVAIFVQLWMF